jgi:hybrid cluster-associated redox disulfide protein
VAETAAPAAGRYDRIRPSVKRDWGTGEMAIFTKDMSIMEALQADPRSRDVFTAYGMGCTGCMGVSMESIEDGAKMHGLDPAVVLAELNKLAGPEQSPST